MDMIFAISAHTKPNGKCPTQTALELFEQVSPKLRAAVEAGIIRLQYQSNHSGNLTEHLSAGLWCLKVRRGNIIARLFFAFTKGAKIYLLNGCTTNKDDAIPPYELRKARLMIREASL
jgi:hypothetical protein